MRQEVHELIEAVRDLEIRVDASAPGQIRLTCDKAEFPRRLHRVALALEAVDRSGAAANEMAGADPARDAARLRLALDGVFRWMKMRGMDLADPLQIVATALRKPELAAKAYRPTPVFVRTSPDASGAAAATQGAKKTSRSAAAKRDELEKMMGVLGPAAPI